MAAVLTTAARLQRTVVVFSYIKGLGLNSSKLEAETTDVVSLQFYTLLFISLL
jgi:hypothetical protein